MFLMASERNGRGVVRTPWARLLAAVLALVLLWSQLGVAYSQGAGSGGEGGGIAITECERNQCFSSVDARQSHAQRNNCYFLEDVCSNFDREAGNRAQEEDRGFWGRLWDAGVGAIQYGYEFIKGLFVGLGDQISDLIDLASDPIEAARGLAELGKQFYDDPAGTIESLAQVLGQEAVNTIVRATQCGAYDLGRVIGQNVNPVVMVRLGTQLARFGGRLDDAVAATRRDLGCASFVAGTPVWLPEGRNTIERMRVGQLVLSRNEKTWTDAPQSITQVFARTAPGIWELATEHERYQLTDEHPVWVQGKGWTEARDIREDDVLATVQGDALVRANTPVSHFVQVYNFSVADTPNYFVGESGLWVHNASCNLPSRYPDSKTTDFEASLVRLPPGERVARVREAAMEAVTSFGWVRDRRVERLNPGRTVYADSQGNLYSLDTQHGRWEKIDGRTGEHISEVHLYQPDRYVENSQRDDHGLRVR